MVTPIGLNASQTCAAVRGGVCAFVVLEKGLDPMGYPITGAPFVTDPLDLPTPDVVTHAALTAGREALRDGGVTAGRRIVVALASSEGGRPGFSLDLAAIEVALRSELNADHEVTFRTYADGHAAGATALRDMADHLRNSSDAVGLLVGADSLLAPETITHLSRSGRLKSPIRPRGLIPGQAAAALVVQSTLTRAVGRPYCRILGIGIAQEPVPVGRDEPCQGRGLTEAIRAALSEAGWPPDSVSRIYCDLNGEEYRGHEWMLAMCRVLTSPSVTHPADCIGDIGAASFPLLAGMAALAFSRESLRGDRAVAWVSSDSGTRGAVCLAA